MRITKIELKDFRAFKGEYEFDLHRGGNNLLVYGENGSGKSSLFLALEKFLRASVSNSVFNSERNIFTELDDGFVRLHLDDPAAVTPDPEATVYEWSATSTPRGKRIISDAAKTRGALDYRGLLKTYFLHHGKNDVDLFPLLIQEFLASIPNPATNQSFGDEWNSIEELLSRRQGHRIKSSLQNRLARFNFGWIATINGLLGTAKELLAEFRYPIEIQLIPSEVSYVTRPKKRFIRNTVVLKATYYGRDIGKHQDFLNEAKLSAIALSIYFAALLQLPSSKLRLLLLDDVLIGLDAVNRLTVLHILRERFSDYQILFTTYDREWFETVRAETANHGWESREMKCGRCATYDYPVVEQSESYLLKADRLLNAGEYEPAANVLRKEMERVLKVFCLKKHVPVPFAKKYETNDLWVATCKFPSEAAPIISQAQKRLIERYRRMVLNAGSHDGASLNEPNVRGALVAVTNLGSILSA